MAGSKSPVLACMMCSAIRSISSGSAISGMPAKYSASPSTSCAYRSVTPRSPLPMGSRAISRLEDHTAYAEELLAFQGIADHRKRLLAYGIAWCDVVRLLDVPGVDLATRNEPLNVDRARVLDDKPGRLGCGRRHGRGGASARAVRLSERCLADRGRCRRLDRRRTGSPRLSLLACDLKLFVLNRAGSCCRRPGSQSPTSAARSPGVSGATLVNSAAMAVPA